MSVYLTFQSENEMQHMPKMSMPGLFFHVNYIFTSWYYLFIASKAIINTELWFTSSLSIIKTLCLIVLLIYNLSYLLF